MKITHHCMCVLTTYFTSVSEELLQLVSYVLTKKYTSLICERVMRACLFYLTVIFKFSMKSSAHPSVQVSHNSEVLKTSIKYQKNE